MQDDIHLLLANLRPRDAIELAEIGIDRAQALSALTTPSVLSRAFRKAERPAAIVAFHALTPKTLTVSLLATDEWAGVARAVYRWGVREARPCLLALGYERAECRTMEGHDAAITLLERFGFVRECRFERYGASGIAFLQYAWRLRDYAD